MFVVRPEVEILEHVNTVLKSDNQKDRDVHILFIPRRTYECDKYMFKNIYVHSDIIDKEKVAHINMDLIQLETDLVSLELPQNFAHFMLKDDDTYKVYV